MAVPTTSIDERYSDDGTDAVSWDDTRRVIEDAPLFWITTVRSDGRPHVTPLVAVWLEDALFFSTGAKEQKRINLEHNPRVALVTGCNEWERGIDVVVEGDAVQVTDDDLLSRLGDVWKTKWDGFWRFEARDGAFHHDGITALAFSVKPTRVLAFSKRPFTHTVHRF
jgi:general stress protein 26